MVELLTAETAVDEFPQCPLGKKVLEEGRQQAAPHHLVAPVVEPGERQLLGRADPRKAEESDDAR